MVWYPPTIGKLVARVQPATKTYPVEFVAMAKMPLSLLPPMNVEPYNDSAERSSSNSVINACDCPGELKVVSYAPSVVGKSVEKVLPAT